MSAGMWTLIIGFTVFILGSGYAIRRRIRQTVNPNTGANQPSNPLPVSVQTTPSATPTTPPSLPKKKRFGWWSLIIVAIIASLMAWKLSSCHSQRVVTAAMVGSKVETPTVMDKTVHYEWYCKLPPGVYVRGRNENAIDERDIEVVQLDDNSIGLNLYYVEYGSREVCRIRLKKVSEKTWEGVWDQDNPADHGRVTMDEVSPGIYAGEITGTSGLTARCYLKRK